VEGACHANDASNRFSAVDASWRQATSIEPEHIAALHDIATERAHASLEEIADELDDGCGVRVCTATIRRAPRDQGIVRLKPTRRVYATAAKGPKR